MASLCLCSLAVLFAAAFGQSPSQRLQADLDAAVRAGRSSFGIPSGVYRFDRVDLMVNSAKDLHIGPTGGMLNVTLLFSCNWGLVLRSCANVSIHNLTIDYDPPCFSQGTITGKHKGNSSIRYTVDDGFPTPDSNSRFQSARVKVIRWDPATQVQLGHKAAQEIVVQHIEGRSYWIKGRSIDVWAGASVGEVVAVAPRVGHTVLLTDCTGCGVLGLTIHGASDMAMVEYGGGGANLWSGNRVVRNHNRRPMGLLVSNADVFQSTGSERGPVVEFNVFSNAGDACMNLHNYFNVVIKRDSDNAKRVLLLDGVGESDLTGEGYDWHQELNTFNRIKQGDVVRVYDQSTMSLRMTTEVTEFEESKAQNHLVLANQTLDQLGFDSKHRNWVGKVRCYWVTLREPIPDQFLTRAFLNVDRLSGSGAIVRSNSFHDCANVAFKSIGGECIDNQFNYTGGIRVGFQQEWLEGSLGLRDVIVAGNVFANTKQPYVRVDPSTTNITIRNNSFDIAETFAV